MPDCSIDTIITDPPYGLKFMGQQWDHGVPGVPFWEAALRVAKPGAMMFAFGGTRTHHRLMCAIEDAGWEIRDCLMWLYGSGFPKGLCLSYEFENTLCTRACHYPRRHPEREKEVVHWFHADGTQRADKPPFRHRLAGTWWGWNCGLKPAWEPIVLAMKPLDGTFAQNAAKWGVAGLWIDGGRIGTSVETWPKSRSYAPGQMQPGGKGDTQATGPTPQGRWPANVVLDEAAGALLDRQSGQLTSGYADVLRRSSGKNWSGGWAGGDEADKCYGDTGGASRFFYCAKASRAEREAGLDGIPTKPLNWSSGDQSPGTFQAEGTQREVQNNHPTVKPIALLRYLCRLTRTPVGGVLLDPFMGSGSTGCAAVMEGRSFIGIEINPEYCEIARGRIAHAEAEEEAREVGLTVDAVKAGQKGLWEGQRTAH